MLVILQTGVDFAVCWYGAKPSHHFCWKILVFRIGNTSRLAKDIIQFLSLNWDAFFSNWFRKQVFLDVLLGLWLYNRWISSGTDVYFPYTDHLMIGVSNDFQHWKPVALNFWLDTLPVSSDWLSVNELYRFIIEVTLAGQRLNIIRIDELEEAICCHLLHIWRFFRPSASSVLVCIKLTLVLARNRSSKLLQR